MVVASVAATRRPIVVIAEDVEGLFFGPAGCTRATLVSTDNGPPSTSGVPQPHLRFDYYDLATGKQKMRWNLPGDNSTCNDIAIGPDKAAYVSDTANAKIFRVPAGGTTGGGAGLLHGREGQSHQHSQDGDHHVVEH